MSTLHIHTKFYSQLTPTGHSRFPSSTLTAGMQPWIRVESFTRPFLPPSLTPPTQKGSGSQTTCSQPRQDVLSEEVYSMQILETVTNRTSYPSLVSFSSMAAPFLSFQMLSGMGQHKVQTNAMKAYRKQRQYSTATVNSVVLPPAML